MSSFDEFYKNSDLVNTYDSEVLMREVYEAGAQSRQAEIDELQKRIGDAIYDLQHIESAMWEEQIDHVLFVLKGNQA